MSKVIKFKKRKVEVNYHLIYFRNFYKSVEKLLFEDDNKDLRVKALYYGVKYINTHKDNYTYDEGVSSLNLIYCIKSILAEFTPNELMKVFPITKRYDGEKWDIKDYCYTINKLKEIGLNNKISEHVDDVLWDYQNDDLFEFSANEFSIASSLKKLKTGKSIGEEWAEEMGIQTYTTVDDGRGGTKFIKNPMQKKKNHLKIIK